MLDAYIIEEIRKQEDERRHRSESARPHLHIDVPSADDDDPPPESEEPTVGGVIHIDL